MSRNPTTRKSTLLAIALGLTALGSTTMPAAALSGRFFFGQSQMMIPHFGGGSHTIGDINRPAQVSDLPKSNTGPVVSKTIGDLNVKPLPLPSGHLPNGVDNVCPFNPLKCHQKGAGDGSTTGNSSSGGSSTNGGSTNNGGTTHTDGGSGTLIVVPTTPVMVPPVVVRNSQDLVAPRHAVLGRGPEPSQASDPPIPSDGSTSASNPDPTPEPHCTCLRKQYLGDGSVLFRDLCTHEAALATNETQALAIAAAAAQAQSQPAAK